jgi:hypothetical protein
MEANMWTLSNTARLVVIVVVALVSISAPSYSQTPAASIRIEIVSGGFIVGATAGSGTLTYKGKRYPLSIGGVSLGATVGASKATLAGQVHNLRKVSDIAGTYAAAEAGYAVVGGRKTARLKNSNGVVLQLRGREVGLELSVDLSGMQISLR